MSKAEWERLVEKKLDKREVEDLETVYYALMNKMTKKDIAKMYTDLREIFDMIKENVKKVKAVQDAQSVIENAADELELEIDYLKDTEYLANAGSTIYKKIAILARDLERLIDELREQRTNTLLKWVWEDIEAVKCRKEAKKNGDI